MLLGRGGGGGGGGRVEMVERARGGERERPVEVEGDGGVHGGEPRGTATKRVAYRLAWLILLRRDVWL